MKSKILKELKNADDYISGQQLCERLGVSRTAVWKHIKALRAEGYEIDSVTNKGYKLMMEPDLLTKEEVASCLHTKWLGKDLHCYETMDSTNLEIRRLAEAGAGHGIVAITEEQTMGKGRRGRSWLAEAGAGIAMSFLLKPQIEAQNSSMLTLVTALAVNEAICETTGIRAKIKWPNDIIVNGKKICGILTEMSLQMDEINYIVVGLGINVNIDHFPEDLSDKATSLQIEGGRKIKRAPLAAKVLECFEKYYDMFLKTEDLSMEKYKNMYQDKVTLCGSNAYEKKYYLNPDFSGLPEQIKQELQIACVLFTAEVGGVLTLEFDEEGKLNFVTHVEDNDFFYDEIGSELMIKKLRQEKQDFWESLELYYKIFLLGEDEV